MSADSPKVSLDNIPLDQGQALPHEISVPPRQIYETQAPDMIFIRELPNESPPPYQPPLPYQSPPPYQPSYPCQLPFEPSQNQSPPSQQNQVPQQPIQVTVPPTIDLNHSIGMYCPYCKMDLRDQGRATHPDLNKEKSDSKMNFRFMFSGPENIGYITVQQLIRIFVTMATPDSAFRDIVS
uniref:LITAF domain-containing protein n=1 Tax=Acrobeloides nanus TaxID=290746 RepID=A0A914ELL1_9BILA